MNGTLKLLEAAKRGDSATLATLLEASDSDTNFWVRDEQNNTILHLLAQNSLDNSKSLTELLVSVYDRMKAQNPKLDPMEQINAAGEEVETYLKENRGNIYVNLLTQLGAPAFKNGKDDQGLEIAKAAGGRVARSDEAIARLFLRKNLPGIKASIAVAFKGVSDIDRAIAIGNRIAGTEGMIAVLLKSKAAMLYPNKAISQLSAEKFEELFNNPRLNAYVGGFADSKKLAFAAKFNNPAALESYVPALLDSKDSLNRALSLTTNEACKAYLKANGAVEQTPVATAKPAQKAKGLSLAGKVLLGVASLVTGGLALVAYGIYKLASKSDAPKVAPAPVSVVVQPASPSIRSVSASTVDTQDLSGQSFASSVEAEIEAPFDTSVIDDLIAQAKSAGLPPRRSSSSASDISASSTSSRGIANSQEFKEFKASFSAEHRNDASFQALDAFEQANAIKAAFKSANIYNNSSPVKAALSCRPAAPSPVLNIA